MNDNNETIETTEVITITDKIKQIAKRAILPSIAILGVIGAITLSSHGKRLDELSSDVEELILTTGDDSDFEIEIVDNETD